MIRFMEQNRLGNILERLPFHEKSSYKWWVLFTVSLGGLSVALDSSILIVCYPALATVFNTDSSVIGWINVAYLTMSQSLGITLAKVGDMKGRKIVYLLGLTFYGAGMLACALSQNPVQLIVSRAIQGVGAATGWSLTTAIAVAVFPAAERGKALGILAGIYSVGLTIGPVLGGLVLDLLGWRAVFYTRFPLVLAALVLGYTIVKEQAKTVFDFRFDLSGALCLLACLTSFMLFLSFGGKLGFGAPWVLLAGVLAAVLLTLFLLIETRTPQPILDLTLFKKRAFSAAILAGGLQNAASATAIFTMPFYLSRALGYSGSSVGVFLAVLAVPLVVVSPLSGRLSDRVGSRFLSVFGMGVLLAALFVLRQLGGNPTYLETMAAIILLGTGMAIFQSPNNSALMGAAPRDKLGIASAILTTLRNIGSSSAIAVASSVYSVYEVSHLRRLSTMEPDMSTAQRIASTLSFQDTLDIGIAISLIGILTSSLRGLRSGGAGP